MFCSTIVSSGSLQLYGQESNIMCQVYARICEHIANRDVLSTIHSQRSEHTHLHVTILWKGYLEAFIIMNILSSSAQC